MNIAIIKDNIVTNTCVFASLQQAQQFPFDSNPDMIIELKSGYGIGDSYKDGEWIKHLPNPITDQETIKIDQDELIALFLDQQLEIENLKMEVNANV